MAKIENPFKKYLVRIMGTRWHVQSHEDKYSDGIPDLSFGMSGVSGWIELKAIPWPNTKHNPTLKPKRYTNIQVNWINRRGKKSGCCFVFVKVGPRDYYLFGYWNARDIKHGQTLSWYQDHCLKHWRGSVCPVELSKELTHGIEKKSAT